MGKRCAVCSGPLRERGRCYRCKPAVGRPRTGADVQCEHCRKDFYRADSWLGAAWKAMPSDLSRDRLGERGLNLLDDMANWGPHKYMPGEVDVFKITEEPFRSVT